MGETDPWQHGPHRVSLMRKIGDEETVLIESYGEQHAEMLTRLDDYLAAIRAHKIAYNRQVILAARRQLHLIERRIEERGQHLRDLDAQLALALQHQGAHAPAEKPNGPVIPDEGE